MKWKWKVSWVEETRLPPKGKKKEKEDEKEDGRLVCIDKYTVWFYDRTMFKEYVAKLKSQGYTPHIESLTKQCMSSQA